MASSSDSTSTAEPKAAHSPHSPHPPHPPHPPLTATSYLCSLPELSTARGQFLYSSFSSRKQSNPTGYAGALSWWRNQLVRMTSQALLGDHRLVIKVDDDLRHLLRTHTLGRPASLATVIVSHKSRPDRSTWHVTAPNDRTHARASLGAAAHFSTQAEMVNDQSCIPLSTYLASPSTHPTSSSGTSLLGLVTRPLGWAASRLLGRASSSASSTTYDDTVEWPNRQGEYVVVPLIEKATTTLLPLLETHLIDPLSRLMTLHTFRARFGSQLLDPDAELSTLDIQVLIKHLCNQGYCVQKGEAIKFRPFHPPTPSTTPPLTVTSSDLSILSLLSTLTQLEAYITSLQTRIETYQSLATTALSTQQPTTLVKSYLAQKRHVQKLLERKVGAREKLSQVVWGIETATSDNEMINAMELGADVLREVVGDPEIKLKRVEEVNERLAQGLEDAKEINEEILGGARVGWSEDGEREIEEELRRLRLDDQREGEKAVEEKLEGTGKVPVGGIGGSKEEDKVRVEEKQEGTRKKVLV